MLTANKLEKIMELEDSLRTQYEEKLAAQTAELERVRAEYAEQNEQLRATIDKQLETITELSGKGAASAHLEQQHRELTNRSEKLQEEFATVKKRVKTLQKELAAEREQVSTLTQ